MADYRAAATKSFNALKEMYGDTSLAASFWRFGNAFDTMIDYFNIPNIDRSSADDVVQMVVKQFEASLNVLKGFDNVWFDDFGWWSVATERALESPYFSANSKQALQKLQNDCWSRFKANAPFVWERHKPGTFDGYAPAVPNGVWNAYWSGTPDKYKGPRGDPSSLAGIQNTVTNAVYLMSAQRIDGWADPAKQELAFLQTWFNEGKTPLWWSIDDTAGLIRERVGHFANGNTAPGFQTDWFWAGDQGLMLANLSDAYMVGVVTDQTVMQNLLRGAIQQLVDGNNVLLNYSTTGYVPSDDTTDYDTGSGVFWRNLLHVWSTNSVTPLPDMKPILSASADATISTDDPFNDLTNQTAVLIAAAIMLA